MAAKSLWIRNVTKSRQKRFGALIKLYIHGSTHILHTLARLQLERPSCIVATYTYMHVLYVRVEAAACVGKMTQMSLKDSNPRNIKQQRTEIFFCIILLLFNLVLLFLEKKKWMSQFAALSAFKWYSSKQIFKLSWSEFNSQSHQYSRFPTIIGGLK